ncbi:MAG: D-alanyl-D-alanine carboxypeptidase, partial [Oscillospiraceae bacterium]
MKNYKACISKFLVFLILLGFLGGFSSPRSLGAVMVNVNPPCKSAILMEGISGKVLFEKDADLKLPPASITKVMSLLLVMEAM